MPGLRRTWQGTIAAAGLALLVTGLSPVVAGENPGAPRYRPGAAGAGDAYFPRQGNGGYDVKRYVLDLRYRPHTDRLSGTARIHARATQHLSRFNLDLADLRVRSVMVDGRVARWRHRGDELVVDPDGPGLRRGHRFAVDVDYGGSPRTLQEPTFGTMGFFHTDDGALVAGEPQGASSWFPVNGHPGDKAAYTFKLDVPSGKQAVANGVLVRRVDHGTRTTWTWRADEPMAPYLATMSVGRFQLDHYRSGGIELWDAIDTDFFDPVALPRTGTQYALTGADVSSYKRLARTIDVPATGGTLTFWARYRLEEPWDFFFVEAHPLGSEEWTTLEDQNGHTGRDTGVSCPAWLGLHPFLEHYQAPAEQGGCLPRGTTGRWRAATGQSDGWEQWRIDLGRYAGRSVEVSLSHASDEVVPASGVFVDDVTVSTGVGSTSFENDGDALDGWRVPGSPPGSPPNVADWRAGTVEQAPPTDGARIRETFSRQPEMLAFLADHFGRYPFATAGGIVDDLPDMTFALETQTRPVYPAGVFVDPLLAETVVVHELAHQWVGNSLTLRRWRDIWLNEGFATYTEWLWHAHEGGPSPRRTLREIYRSIPRNDSLWDVRIGNPGPENLFHVAIYLRGAMTLQALRERIGSDDFATLLRRWTSENAGRHVTTRQFIRTAERVSGRQLDPLFRTWLFRAARPRLENASRAGADSRLSGTGPPAPEARVPLTKQPREGPWPARAAGR